MDLAATPLIRLPAGCTIALLSRSGWVAEAEPNQALKMVNAHNPPLEGTKLGAPTDGTTRGWLISWHSNRPKQGFGQADDPADDIQRNWAFAELTNKEGEWVYTNRRFKLVCIDDGPNVKREVVAPAPVAMSDGSVLAGRTVLPPVPVPAKRKADEPAEGESENKEPRTLDVLGRNDDEHLVVAPGEKKPVEALEEAHVLV